MSSGFGGGGVGAGGGGGGVAGVEAAEGGVSLGGAFVSALRSQAAIAANNSRQQAPGMRSCVVRVGWAKVMAPLYHGRAWHGSDADVRCRRATLRAVGLLDESGLDRLLDIGCTKCGARKLTFASYVDGLLPIMGGEPVGKITWV